MLSIRSTIVASLNNEAPDYVGIRENIGRYLHLLQDFYSNTNWVELYPDDLNTDLGRSSMCLVCFPDFHHHFISVLALCTFSSR